VSPAILYAIYFVALLIFTVVSIALMYHWKNYNAYSSIPKRMIRTYFLVSGAFLFAMLIAVIAYST